MSYFKTIITKTAEEMSVQELQKEIGRLQSILFHKIAGDQTKGLSWPQGDPMENYYGKN